MLGFNVILFSPLLLASLSIAGNVGDSHAGATLVGIISIDSGLFIRDPQCTTICEASRAPNETDVEIFCTNALTSQVPACAKWEASSPESQSASNLSNKSTDQRIGDSLTPPPSTPGQILLSTGSVIVILAILAMVSVVE
ncbi:hypothetical protein DFH07DRAFT_797553 [Mycena maculata]|uniref:Uncharacterized protein n=1 Tax=Mycena maculata TaxID=230809 RepID=A0AAD7K6E3_9AGAR|nr:hypothetical protein DFH07DRAFT_797553 [Mycena maculata]